MSLLDDRARTATTSFAQERLWLLDRLEPGNPAGNLRAGYRVGGPLDSAALAAAWQHLVDRHEALRTTFTSVGGRPVQVIAAAMESPLACVDLTALPVDRREEEVHRLATAAVGASFDLGTGPLVRVTLFRLARDTHVLLFVFHHIACDGWSMGVLMRELLDVYGARLRGCPPDLPALPLRYADVAAWEREALDGELLARLRRYWTTQLAGVPPVLALPTDRPRPAVQTYAGSEQRRALAPDLARALTRLGGEERATLFMVLLAGLAALLARWSDQDDLVIGSPVANRRRAEHEALVGCFLNMLALRVDLAGDPDFRTLLRRVRDVALAAMEHQEMPFEVLVEELNPERSLSQTPLFQVMLVLQNVPSPPLHAAGLRCDRFEVASGASRFDLSLFAWPHDGLHLTAEFNRDLFEDATVARLLEHFERLLSHVVANPDEPLSRVPLLTPEERHTLLHVWNDTSVDHGAGASSSVHGLFGAQASSTPDALALLSGRERMTFGELDARSAAVARRLLDAGVRPGDLVGVALGRGPDAAVALLAALRAGAAFVALEPDQPPARLDLVVRDSGLQVVVASASSRAGWDRRGVTVVPVETTPADRGGGPNDVGRGPDDPAYVVYTSGSTGTPKGVVNLHGGAVNRFRWMWRTYPFAPGEVCCQKTSLGFADSVWEIFGPLLRGVPLVVVPDEEVRDPRRLVETLARHDVTRIVLVPSLLRALLTAEPELGARLPKLTTWVTSGEVLTPSLRDRFRVAVPGSTLLNLYGSSEVSADALCHDATRDLPGSAVPIGRPIDNSRVYVLDPRLEPVPIGLPGEIHVGGVGVARGYLHRPELDASRFVPDPYLPGGRLHRTGDRGRFDPHGNVHYLGRRDRQVKVRGYRVEPGEVEAVLETHAGVRAAAVVAHGGPDDIRLAAYVVALRGSVVSPSDVRAFVSGRLPGYMVPSAVVTLDELPLTTSGKVDATRLPDPAMVLGADAEALQSPLERQLRGIWERCLRRPGIGRHDDFFEVGGNSLLAVRLLEEIERLVGRRLPLATVIEAPTIARQAAVLADSGWPPPWRSLVPMRPGGSKLPFFCVPGLSGKVMGCRALADHLDPDRPFFGLQARGLSGQEPHVCIEDMAMEYLEEIRSVQAEGPYLLGGWCFGGNVALEMARQLTAQGEEVAALVVIEGYAPGTGPRTGRRADRWRLRLRTLRFEVDALGWAVAAARLARRLDQRRRRLVSHDRQVKRANLAAVRNYRPDGYGGRVIVLRGMPRPPRFDVPHLGWDRLAASVDVRDIPGSHTDLLLEPHVRALAAALGTCLDDTGA